MEPVTLQVAPEIVAVGAAFQGLVADIKSGKTVVADLTDAFTVLVPALGSAMNLGTDIKSIDNQAYLVRAILQAFEPAAAPAAATVA